MSTLLDIRKRLVLDSGHFELVKDVDAEDWQDNGANALIQSGQRFLDNRFEYHKQDAWLFQNVSSGQSLVTFQNARYVKEVWIFDHDSNQFLDRQDPLTLRQYYNAPPSKIDGGRPRFWAPAPVGLAPQQDTKTQSDFESEPYDYHELIKFGDHYSWRGIIIFPPPDQRYTLQILSAWYSKELKNDTDQNFWTVEYPDLLVRAARRSIEIDLHRNRSGRADFEEPLLIDLATVAQNLISEEVSGPPELFVVQG